MQIEHIDISGMGTRVGKDSLTLRRKREILYRISLFFVSSLVLVLLY